MIRQYIRLIVMFILMWFLNSLAARDYFAHNIKHIQIPTSKCFLQPGDIVTTCTYSPMLAKWVGNLFQNYYVIVLIENDLYVWTNQLANLSQEEAHRWKIFALKNGIGLQPLASFTEMYSDSISEVFRSPKKLFEYTWKAFLETIDRLQTNPYFGALVAFLAESGDRHFKDTSIFSQMRYSLPFSQNKVFRSIILRLGYIKLGIFHTNRLQ